MSERPSDPATATGDLPDRGAAAAALEAVRRASRVTRRAQLALVAGDVATKADASPVTVADLAAQAVVWRTMSTELGHFDMVGEEDARLLGANEQLAGRVAELVGAEIAEADPTAVAAWIDAGSSDGVGDSFWTLDPIDGTKGFLRGDQYAIALARMVHGEVDLAVLGCPNLTNADGSLGAVLLADSEGCRAWYGDSLTPTRVRVSSPSSLARARICESVEAGHSRHDHADAIARRLGIEAEPYRIDSQCKYAVVARGDASIYLRLPTRPDHREKIWDHAAGKFVVEQAGGTVTDINGADLTFGLGRRLERNSGVVASDGRYHDQILAAVAEVLGGETVDPRSS